MPFQSQAQRRKFYAMASRGEISEKTLNDWETATPRDKKLPERVKQALDQRIAAGLSGAALGGLTGAVWDGFDKPSLKGALYGAGIGGGLGVLSASASRVTDAARERARQRADGQWRRFWEERDAGSKSWDEWAAGARGAGGRAGGRSRAATPPSWVGSPKTKAEAKAAYHREAMKNHPDRGGDVEKMKAVNAEWDAFTQSPAFDKLAAAFLDELVKIANMAGLVMGQIARRQVAPTVDQAISDLEDRLAARWQEFSSPPTLD